MTGSGHTSWFRRLLFVPPVLVAVLILMFVVSRQQPPERKPVEEIARTVRVIEARQITIIPRITGFGTVRPANVWNAVAQVSGQVVYVHPDFKRGEIIDKGTEILRIDPADYELAIAEAEANIRSAEASLAELKVNEQNSRELLALETRSLELKDAQLKRTEDLLQRGTVSQSSVDVEQRDTIAQRTRVKEVENNLRLLPTQIEVQQQQIAVNRSRLATAELNLSRTVIKLPYRARISQVNVEATQYVQTGSTLGAADDIAVSEVEAQFSIARISQFGRSITNGRSSEAFTEQNFRRLAEQSGLHAIIRLTSSVLPVEWKGRVVRASDEVAEKTRTIGLIAAVEGSYDQAIPGKRPPLTKGMFVEMELRGPAIADQVTIPRSALHGEQVYIADADSRLEIRSVKTGLVQGDAIVVEEGLVAGEMLVVSDLSPAIPGMLLNLVEDRVLAKQLAAEAGGEVAEAGQ